MNQAGCVLDVTLWKGRLDAQQPSDKGAEVIGQGSPDIALADILSEMRAFSSEIKETNKEFRGYLETYSEWIIENGNKIYDIRYKIKLCSTKRH